MKKQLFLVIAAIAAAAVQPIAYGQSPDISHEDRDVVRVMRHPDGSRSVYKRQANWRGMRCATYSASGKLAAINDYTEDKHGLLVGCTIYDSNRQPIYKVSYGYDRQARLVEERMFSVMDGKLVQRVIYRYNSSGERTKPLIVSLNNTGTTIGPTMNTDVENAHRTLPRNRR
ncbi:MAG: hypothetical protein Q4A24_10320 [Akkermansia sp.]|nr:hypothetical protein [Akkermansia sp.]